MEFHSEDMAAVIRAELERFDAKPGVEEVGRIEEIGDGICRVSGLQSCMTGEMLHFPNGSAGLALNLEPDRIGCVVLGEYRDLAEGDEVTRGGRVLEVPVGQGLLGRVVDPLGRPVDGKGPIKADAHRKVESPAPGLADRKSVCEPLQTGLKAIDSMTPVGRGQRELIIGDRKTGKTSICTDTIINQRESGVICVYVAIGQKESTVAGIFDQLTEAGAMDYTIIVSAPASAPAPMQFLAPYAGCAMAEHFMYRTWAVDEDGLPIREDGRYRELPLADGGRGMHGFIAYDDLSKQAAAYREMSLLLRRPPGREAYPGDVFYLHSRLLERAAKLDDRLGGGSLTAFPIIETQEGEVSAYIPTNVISITDGQIYLQPDLFNAGIRPAVDVGISVSRVGGAAQVKGMKQVASTLRLELAAFRELKAFAQLSSDMDKATRRQLDRGERMVELLKQALGWPMHVIDQILVLAGAGDGLFDRDDVEHVERTEKAFLRYMREQKPDLVRELEGNRRFGADGEEAFRQAIQDFLDDYDPDDEVEEEEEGAAGGTTAGDGS